MSKTIIETRIEATPETMGALEIIVREGARKMLQAALEAEIEEHLSRFKNLVDEEGKRLVVRNGVMPERTVLTGAGPIPITRPRVDDRALDARGEQRFTSRIHPPFMRRAPSIDTLVPVLYLKGISDRRLSDGAGGDPWPPGERTFGEHRRAPEGDMDRGIRGVIETGSLGETLCLRLGRWRVLQRPSRG
ncbi:hypothetical protein SPIRO4BDMA_40810 [uncultured spirochete]|uniref:Mutator family transposase n=1 Tax=uncultured spirochete TaxID=156406 RepID=A0A3P3XPM6_9SPIR|nr:hypothetical protein SPIRO4BDMA_40810 [uncultured spirochete]